MKRGSRWLVAVVLLGLLSAVAAAQTGGDYTLVWSSLDGGGATFSLGGSYSLGGTAGQADAGSMSGGSYVLQGGFWALAGDGHMPPGDRWSLYLPLLLRLP